MYKNDYFDEELENLPDNIKIQLKNDDMLFSELENDDILEGITVKKYNEDIDDEKEIQKMFKNIEKEVEEEILKEMKDKYEPINKVDEEDHNRANKILERDEFIKQAYLSQIITFEEIVYFVDYYEIFSLINKTKKVTSDLLNNINSLSEDNELKDIRDRIIRSLNSNESILDIDFDYNKLKFFVTEEIKEKADIPILKNLHNISDKKLNINNTKEKIKVSNSKISIQSINKNPNQLKNSIELFTDDNKLTNLLKVRNNRKEMLKTKFGGKSKNSELFKFDTKKVESDMKKQFLEFLEMPLKIIDDSSNKKNSVRKKIEDAINYYKNKY
jgi:hypothetical protein